MRPQRPKPRPSCLHPPTVSTVTGKPQPRQMSATFRMLALEPHRQMIPKRASNPRRHSGRTFQTLPRFSLYPPRPLPQPRASLKLASSSGVMFHSEARQKEAAAPWHDSGDSRLLLASESRGVPLPHMTSATGTRLKMCKNGGKARLLAGRCWAAHPAGEGSRAACRPSKEPREQWQGARLTCEADVRGRSRRRRGRRRR
ncbi:hypothetical protein STEG23_010898 [Scotinomys teguina]